MSKSKILIIIVFLVASTIIASAFLSGENTNDVPTHQGDKIKGLSFVAPPRPFTEDPMIHVTSVNAEWIAVIPYAFIPNDDHLVHHSNDHRWWGERTEGVNETIRKAREHHLKVMLKPQVWVRGNWIGDFHAGSDEKWKEWEESYRKYLMTYVEIAEQQQVELICIGTEVRMSMRERPEFWKSLIKEIRSVYSGQLTYSSNWDEFKNVSIWDELDFIGISAYFPLTNTDTPTHGELMKKWKPKIRMLRRFSKKHNKPILFTEFGYLSMDGCAGKTWILENARDQYNANPEAQANALHCLFDAFWKEPFWAGGFLWKWYPELREGRDEFYQKDYTPQGKLAEQTITEWYSK